MTVDELIEHLKRHSNDTPVLATVDQGDGSLGTACHITGVIVASPGCLPGARKEIWLKLER